MIKRYSYTSSLKLRLLARTYAWHRQRLTQSIENRRLVDSLGIYSPKKPIGTRSRSCSPVGKAVERGVILCDTFVRGSDVKGGPDLVESPALGYSICQTL